MRWKWKFLLAPPAMIAIAALFGEVVMYLWNWLMPSLFGWHPIGFWQALGLLVLCRILFGGFGGHGSGRSKMRRHWAERWEQMTPEEREKYWHGRHERCGGFGARPNEAGKQA